MAPFIAHLLLYEQQITDEIREKCAQIDTDEILHKPLREKAKSILERYVCGQLRNIAIAPR